MSLSHPLTFFTICGAAILAGCTGEQVQPDQEENILAQIQTMEGELVEDWGARMSLSDLRNAESVNNTSTLHITRVSEGGLAQLKELESLSTLHLAGSDITDEQLAHLEDVRFLRRLDLSDTSITGTGLQHLRIEAGSEIHHGLERLVLLDSLILNGTSLTDEELKHVAKIKSLKRLGLARTQITDDGLAMLAGLDQLEELELSGTKVTDAGVSHLNILTNLKRLGLRDTEVTEQGFQQLTDLPHLSDVRWKPKHAN